MHQFLTTYFPYWNLKTSVHAIRPLISILEYPWDNTSNIFNQFIINIFVWCKNCWKVGFFFHNVIVATLAFVSKRLFLSLINAVNLLWRYQEESLTMDMIWRSLFLKGRLHMSARGIHTSQKWQLERHLSFLDVARVSVLSRVFSKPVTISDALYGTFLVEFDIKPSKFGRFAYGTSKKRDKCWNNSWSRYWYFY